MCFSFTSYNSIKIIYIRFYCLEFVLKIFSMCVCVHNIIESNWMNLFFCKLLLMRETRGKTNWTQKYIVSYLNTKWRHQFKLKMCLEYLILKCFFVIISVCFLIIIFKGIFVTWNVICWRGNLALFISSFVRQRFFGGEQTRLFHFSVNTVLFKFDKHLSYDFIKQLTPDNRYAIVY